jgi:predicted metal-binding protein
LGTFHSKLELKRAKSRRISISGRFEFALLRSFFVENKDLAQYLEKILHGSSAEAKVIHPSSVVTAPWVRLKCQFGCPRYGRSYCCPPDTPGPEVTRSTLDAYQRAILFHIEAAKRQEENRSKLLKDFMADLVELEGEMFKDGFYRAFVLLSGPCGLCKECGKLKGKACEFGYRARPSMEACGIDVYQTARNQGFPIKPLKQKDETQNLYCLMLVD